jgi:hypothetical protein
MPTSIFIRSYHKDIEWLKWCLKSIEKYCTGFCELVLCYPQGQSAAFSGINFSKFEFHKITSLDYRRDYLGQQVSKLMAYKHCKGDFILYVDSDCLFNDHVTPETYQVNGKPILYKTPYELVGDAICWKPITELAVGFEVNFEYMRSFPFLFHKDSVKNAVEKYIPYNIEYFILDRRANSFSEFNFLGALIEKNESSKYHIIRTDTEAMYDRHLTQRWSWGGLTSDVVDQIKKELGAF